MKMITNVRIIIIFAFSIPNHLLEKVSEEVSLNWDISLLLNFYINKKNTPPGRFPLWKTFSNYLHEFSTQAMRLFCALTSSSMHRIIIWGVYKTLLKSLSYNYVSKPGYNRI